MSALRLAPLIVSAGFVLFGGDFASAQTGQAGRSTSDLRIAAWNLRHLTPEEQARIKQKQQPAKRVWRNTFGTERRTETWRLRSAAGIDADVVAIQGGKNLTEVRRMFPARTYHLIVSRAALSEPQGTVPGTAGADAGGFTSIAVRRRQGLRVIGQRHFLAPALDRNPIRQAIPGVAIRLRVARQPLWVASFDIRDRCPPQPQQPPRPDCDQERLMRATIANWIERTRAAGLAVVLAGRLAHLPGVTARTDAGARKGDNARCTHTKPRVVLLQGAATTGTPSPRLSARASPEKRPCAALADLDLVP